MNSLWKWLETNRQTLAVVTPLSLAIIGGLWAAFVYFDERSRTSDAATNPPITGAEQTAPVVDANPWANAQALFFESFDLNYEDSLWFTGQDGSWLRELDSGAYCFGNQQGSGEVDYQYIEVDGADNANLPVAVDVQVMSGTEPVSSAGILYRFDQESRFYYAVTLTSTGQLNVYKRNDIGYNTLYAGDVSARAGEGATRLAVAGRGDELHVFINEEPVRVVRDDELRTGSTGIIALGTGRYCFDNFAVYQEIEALF